MTPENQAKEDFLNRYRWSIRKLEEIDLEISRCRLGVLPGAISYDGMPHGSIDNAADLANYAAQLDELIAKFKAVREQALRELREISDAVEAVTDAKSNILLRYHYIMLYSWEKTANMMGYTHEYVRSTLKGKALAEFKIL